MDRQLPDDFDWVTARARCSAADMYEILRDLAQVNVTKANAIYVKNAPSADPDRFGFRDAPDPTLRQFNVWDKWGLERRTVQVQLDGDAIRVHGSVSREFRATLTLTDGGNCKFRVGEAELDPWQLLRRALEPLFFGDHVSTNT